MPRKRTAAEAAALIAAHAAPHRKRGRPEANLVVKPCLHWLALAGFECWTVVGVSARQGKGTAIRHGLPDMPVAMNPSSGWFIMVEFKAPGEKLKPAQQQFAELAEDCRLVGTRSNRVNISTAPSVHCWQNVGECQGWLIATGHMVPRPDGAWVFPYA